MKGLKIIPIFLVLIVLTYTGMLFVQANSDMVSVQLGGHTIGPMASGFMVLSSVFLGMVVCGLLCSVEMLGLYVQNRKLKKKLSQTVTSNKAVAATPPAQDITAPKASGRFT